MTKSRIEFNKTLIQTITALVIVSWFLVIGKVGAQQAPEFLASWKASNYVPADYQGKALPSNSTNVEISFDLIDGGRIVDLSRNQVRWSINDQLFRSGIGVKAIQFTGDGSEQTIRITVLDYNERDLDEFIVVPSARPEVAINTKAPSGQIGLGNYLFEALPYFFNINNPADLNINWQINGQGFVGLAEAPQFLNLNLTSEYVPGETELDISVNARGIFQDLEGAFQRTRILIR